MSEHLTRRELVLGSVDDLAADFLSCDRKDEIKAAIAAGEVSVADIIWRFALTLRTALGGTGRESQD